MAIKHIVVVGAGFAGVKLARELADKPGFLVTLISDKDYFCYYPTLYHSATGHPGSESSIPLERIFGQTANVMLMQDTVTGLDVKTKVVGTASGKQIDYDVLVLALGVVTSFFGIEGLEEHTFGVKSVEQVEALKSHFHQVLIDEQKPDVNYIVVGAGPTGVELSAAMSSYLKTITKNHRLKRRKISIELVEAAPRVLPRSSERVSKMVEKRLRRLGVRVMVGQKVEGATVDSLTANGRPIPSQTVIWTAGVTNHPFFKQFGKTFTINERGKVTVDAYLQAAPNVYVLGDNAATEFSGLAQTAVHDGHFVAENLLRQQAGQPLKEYSIKAPATVVPVGRNWAVLEWGSFSLGGRAGALLRRAADLIGYNDVLPIGVALQLWLSRHAHHEDCIVCRRNALAAGSK
jgi:NADH:ubiquinone reductase (H+-translocating)